MLKLPMELFTPLFATARMAGWSAHRLEELVNNGKIIRPAYEETEGSPVLFPAWAFAELKNLPEGKGGGVVVQRHIHEVYRVSVSNPFELADVDTPEMLTMLEGFCHD